MSKLLASTHHLADSAVEITWRLFTVSIGVLATAFLAATPVQALDTDGDGMPDDWEAQYGLNTNSAADAATDLDADGYVNLYEFIWGTIPTDPNSISLETYPVAAADTYSLYARDEGQAFAWGDNSSGQIGIGTTGGSTTRPARVHGLSNVGFISNLVAVGGGDGHSVGLRSDGTVWSWGDNATEGRLGNNSIVDTNSPIRVLGIGGAGFLSNVISIAVGGDHTLALRGNGRVCAWGANASGQLGDKTAVNRRFPTNVVALAGGPGFLSNVVAIAAGQAHSLALLQNGRVCAWGNNGSGRLGVGTTSGQSTSPTQVLNSAGTGPLSNIVAISAGDAFSLALDQTGQVWAWGENGKGQLGINSTVDSSRPVKVFTVSGGVTNFFRSVFDLSAGQEHSLAIRTNGTVWAWGVNGSGRLGDNTTTDRKTPVQVFGVGGTGFLQNIEFVSAGAQHSLVIGAQCKVYAWGENALGRLGDGTTVDKKVPVIIDQDSVKPTLSTPANVTIECDDSSEPSNTGMATATDNRDTSPLVTYLDTVLPGSCPDARTILRVWNASDNCGNQAVATQVIAVVEITPPVLVGVPSNVVVNCGAVPSPATVTATDNCDAAPAVGFSEITTSGSCPGNYTIRRTWTAQDDCSNTVSGIQTVIVQDVTAPIISCPAAITVQCLGDVPAANTNLVTATDNCTTNPAKTFVSDAPVTNGCVITITRTYRATDACGNTTDCTQTITVQDTTAPAITCPAAVTVQCLGDVPAANISAVTASDNCSTPAKSFVSDSPVSNGCVITITRTYRATDACGNTADCTQTITVQDTTPPAITCPAAVTVQCLGDVPAANINAATASDNCSTPAKSFVGDSSVTNGCVITMTRTYRATDACGNTADCTQTITVSDTTAPAITCPAAVTVQCTADVPAANISAVTANDNCSTPAKTFEGDSSLTNGCIITITRTYRATDACGNTADCTQTITVQDTTAPAITSPAAVTVQCIADVPAVNTNAVTASDNCSTPTKSFVGDSSLTNGCIITITRTYRATDACGNTADCTQTITVEDTTSPAITCPAPVTVQCRADVPAANISAVTANDNCSTPAKTFEGDSSLTNGCIITITRTYRATDACGNTADCTQTITVEDTTSPAITCPAPVTVQCIADVPAVNANAATASDNCSTPAKSFVGDSSLTNGCIIAITRTYRATDACGNTADCTQTITVNDTTPPQITCPAAVSVQCLADVPAENVNDVTATDNCSNPAIIHVGDASQTNGCIITITRTYRATDACGNTADCMQTITVEDTTAPVLSGVPSDVTVECGAVPPVPLVSATDSCHIVSTSTDGLILWLGMDSDESGTVSDLSGGGHPGTVYGATFTTTGRVGGCYQFDGINDRISGPDIGVLQTGTVAFWFWADIVEDHRNPFSSRFDGGDSCLRFEEDSNGNLTGGGIGLNNPRLFTTALQSGRWYHLAMAWNANQTWGYLDGVLVFQGTRGPMNLNFSDVTLGNGYNNSVPRYWLGRLDELRMYNRPLNASEVQALADTSATSVEFTQSQGGSCPATVTRTWTSEDACGNSTSAVQVITVVDTTPPNLSLPTDKTIDCDEESSTSFTGSASATDNCDPAPGVSYSDAVDMNEPVAAVTSFTNPSVAFGGDQTIGYSFTVNSNITVTALGWWENPAIPGLNESHTVAIFSLGGTLLASAVVTPSSIQVGDYRYATLSSPLLLTNGAEYVIAGVLGSDYYVYLADSITTIPDVTYIQSYFDSNTGLTFPSPVPPAEKQYLTVNFMVGNSGPGCATETITRTWTATDDCGNSTSSDQTITVVHTTAPVLTMPADTTVVCGESVDPSVTGYATGVAVGCGGGPEGEESVDGLVLKYTFATDQGSTVPDESGNFNTANVIDATFNGSGLCNGAYDFDGDGDRLEISDSPSLRVQTMTLSVWVRPAIDMNDSLNHFILSKEMQGSPGGYVINYSDGFDFKIMGGGYYSTYYVTNIVAGQWYHVVGTYDGATRKLYINGELKLSIPGAITLNHNGEPVQIGAQAPGTEHYWNGQIDEVRLWNRAFSDSEVAALHDLQQGCSVSTGSVVITYSDESSPSTCENGSVITRTWTATDGCGNTTSAVQVITVVSATNNLTITCPADITIECGFSTSPYGTGFATATDDCDGSPEIDYFDETSGGPCEYTIIRTWTATNACGNSASCVQTITLTDGTAPTITCPADVTVDCTGDTSPAATGSATGEDSCGGSVAIDSFDINTTGCGNNETIRRIWIATDMCGNYAFCQQMIARVDTTIPELTVPADTTVECGESVDPSATGYATAVDSGCDATTDPVDVTYSDQSSPGGCVNGAMITRTWTATDGCGNTTSAAQVITVTDTTAPELFGVPADETIECESSVPEPPTVTAIDVCENGRTAQPEEGLLLRYSFDADQGSMVSDISGNGHIGTVNGASHTGGGISGDAYHFDGQDDWISAGNLGMISTGAIAFWMNADAVQNWRNPFSTEFAGWDDVIRFEEAANGLFVVGALGLVGSTTLTTNLQAGTWYHVVFTWDQTNAWGYLDGDLKFQASHTGVYPPGMNLDFNNVAIGNGYSMDAVRFWKGLIDDVRIYNRGLSAGDVAALYEGSGSSAGLAVDYTSVTNGTCPAEIIRTWTATDACGNTTNATQTISLVNP